MTVTYEAVALAQAEERLRQERELFNQKRAQDEKNFALRLAMGWTTVMLFVAICTFCGYIIVNNSDFTPATVVAATSALLVEAVGLVAATWRGNLGSGPRELEPTTAALPPSD
jgi:hypothetical protein